MCGVLGRLKIHARPTFYFTNGLIVGWNNVWMDESLEYNENEDEKREKTGRGSTLLYFINNFPMYKGLTGIYNIWIQNVTVSFL